MEQKKVVLSLIESILQQKFGCPNLSECIFGKKQPTFCPKCEGKIDSCHTFWKNYQSHLLTGSAVAAREMLKKIEQRKMFPC